MDAKLQEVMLDYGLEGYGLYWYCIELIAQGVNGDNLTFELEHDCRIIARNTGSTPQKVEQMMKSFIDLGLLNAENGHVFCLKLASRCDDFTAKAVRRNGIKPVTNQSVGVSPSLSVFVPLEEEEEVRKRSKKIEDIRVKEIIDFLNITLQSKYKHTTKSHIENISARLNDGHSADDLKLVIKSKANEWLNDKVMAQYLRPSTLFQASKFQGYLLHAKPLSSINKPKGFSQ
ncbi:MAG: putative phage protein (TIGR02220 family) [Oceanospirillaceae bacterium]|jgi:uncharacterized phage protein (TIGR02220 family)